MVYFQIAPAVKLWAENEEVAKVAMDLLDRQGEPCMGSDTRYYVFNDGVRVNEEVGDWGIACRGRGTALAFMRLLGLDDCDIEYAHVRKPHEKSTAQVEKRNRIKSLAPIVIERRKAMGWNQDDLAKKVGLSRSAICAYEKGHRVPHEAALIFKILNIDETRTDRSDPAGG